MSHATPRNMPAPTPNRWGRLYALADEHHGVITLAMAAGLGISRSAVRRRAVAEGWGVIARGAWLLPGAPRTHRALAAAHLLLLGDRAAVGHESAAHLHGLLEAPPARPQFLVPNDRRVTGRAGAQVRRSRTLLTSDLTTVDGLRVTRIPRTIRDLAPRRTWDQCYDMVTDAEQRRLVAFDELAGVAERLRAGPGGSRFASVVETRASDRSDSALERDTRTATAAAGFDPSSGPFPIRVQSGRRIWLDVAFAPIWFAIECDGMGFHSSRSAFERDRMRWRQAQRSGWRLTWVTRRRLREDLDGLLEEVADAHRTADPARPPAVPAA